MTVNTKPRPRVYKSGKYILKDYGEDVSEAKRDLTQLKNFLFMLLFRSRRVCITTTEQKTP